MYESNEKHQSQMADLSQVINTEVSYRLKFSLLRVNIFPCFLILFILFP